MIAYTDTSFQIDEDVAIPQFFDEDGIILDSAASNVLTDFPNGTRRFPVSTAAAAGTISASVSKGKILLKPGSLTINNGDITIPTKFKGEGRTACYITFGASVVLPSGCEFNSLMLLAVFTTSGGSYGTLFRDCYLGSGSSLPERCNVIDTELYGTITIREKSSFIRCSPSRYANDEVVIQGPGGSVENFLVAFCAGNWKFQNMNAATGPVMICGHMGKITIESSVTYTAFKIYGACEVVNNGGTGVTVDFIPFSEAADIASIWSYATRSLTEPVDLNALTQAQIDAIETALSGGVRDLTDDEVKQLRDALGIDGTKVAATGGQLQGKLSKNDMVDYQNRTVVTREDGNPKTYKIGTGANEKLVTVTYVDVGGGDMRADVEVVS